MLDCVIRCKDCKGFEGIVDTFTCKLKERAQAMYPNARSQSVLPVSFFSKGVT